jgi:FKBP-type peptidyl-prolyl cis-trans isomerases 1
MKTIKLISVAAVALLFLLTSCGGYKTVKPIEGITQGQLDSASYSLGTWMALTVKNSGFQEQIDLNQVIKAFNDELAGKSKFEEQVIFEVLNNYTQVVSMAKGQANIKKGQEFLEKNKTKEGVVTLESGLQYKILWQGSGAYPTIEDTVEVNYKGSFIDGTEFDSSEKNGGSVTFPLDGVIAGWGEGIPYINEGGKIMLYIPSDMAYGQEGRPGIDPNSVLIFEVELIKVTKGEPTEEPIQ